MNVQMVILAGKFLAILERDLLPKDFKEACRRNKTIAPGLCASHDFCDANMVMDEAWSATVDHEMTPSSTEDAALWSGAWEIAAKAMGANAPDTQSYKVERVSVSEKIFEATCPAQALEKAREDRLGGWTKLPMDYNVEEAG